MTWEDAILEALGSRGGRSIDLPEIYAIVEKYPFITRHHLEIDSHGQARYKHTVRSMLANLKKEGKIEQLGRGLYRLIK